MSKLPPIQHLRDLTRDNTLRLTQRAQHFADIHSESELEAVVTHAQQQQWPLCVLGGGSNVVLAGEIPGLTLRQVNTRIHHDYLDGTHRVRTTVSAGTPWQTLVDDTLSKDIQGLENLTRIPGRVGAAPVQNIGAYGVELCERLISVRALQPATGQWHDFTREDCDFSYRQSFFKQHPGQYIITAVTLDLGSHHALMAEYRPLREYLDTHHEGVTNLHTIADSVSAIRSSKLPDPELLPNAGSFFHNPVISEAQFNALQERYPDMVGYAQNDGGVKVAAGWLIEQAGFKGYRCGGVGVHTEQALVLVHYGDADSEALLALANDISATVSRLFDIALKMEPTVLG